MNSVRPLYFYLAFVTIILASRFFEDKVITAYYFLVVLGWIFFALAVRNYFIKRKNKPKVKRRK